MPQNSEPLCQALLEAIGPTLVIIPDSEFPASRRAGALLRRRLARRGVPVLFTADTGAVRIALRPGRWEACTQKGMRVSGRYE
jgi:hypothetical protein